MEEISIPMMAVTLWETFGWLSVVGAVVAGLLLIMLGTAILRVRSHGLPVGKVLLTGVILTVVVAAILTPFVPVWTLAPVGDLRGPVDYLLAFLMALGPAAIVGVLWIYRRSIRQPMAN